MTRKTSQPRENATDAYAATRNDIARLMDVLDMELERHDARAKHDPRNRGLAGNLEKVRSDLIDTVAFISGMDREAIDAFLADAE
jgi:hypothetical protein